MEEEEPARSYTSVDFHTEVIALFKRAAMRLDFAKNPLDWEDLPMKLILCMDKALLAAYDDQRYGPEVVEFAECGEVGVGVYIDLFGMADGVSSKSKLMSDILVQRSRQDGHSPESRRENLREYIAALELSIDRAKEKAIGDGWF